MRADPNMFRREWVLYDGACAFCQHWVDFWRTTLERRGFGIAPLQEPWVAERLAVPPEKLLYDLRLLTSDGRVVAGENVYLYVARRIWWAWPFFALFSLPGFNRVLHGGYRWFAANRYCISGTCVQSRAKRTRACAAWLPLFVLPPLAFVFTWHLPRWVEMWALAFAIFAGCKWLTFWRMRAEFWRVPLWHVPLYLSFWPGMDPAPFTITLKEGPRVRIGEWISAALQLVLGVALVWFVSPRVNGTLPRAWIGAVGILFLLHFGLFRLLAFLFRAAGFPVEPIMRAPASACSLAAFWSVRWNRGFNDLAHAHVFRPLQKRVGPRVALLAGFIVSGFIHELVISLPAGGGYGLPALYFLLQAAGVLLERSRVGHRVGIDRGIRGWIFMVLFTALPAYGLFHPLFMVRVMAPFLNALRA